MLICGIDEAGRGPLAGPVFAAAVILDPTRPIFGLADSKVLSAKRRQQLEGEIKSRALAWCVASASVEEIDSINILQATMLAMQRACLGLASPADLALVDGNRAPNLPCQVRTIVKGDASEAAISAASILAKCARDADCELLHQQYPQFGFDRHKGYPTAAHLQAIQDFGVTSHHRRSFGPVKVQLQKELPL
jgi:ribonuclease HII